VQRASRRPSPPPRRSARAHLPCGIWEFPMAFKGVLKAAASAPLFPEPRRAPASLCKLRVLCKPRAPVLLSGPRARRCGLGRGSRRASYFCTQKNTSEIKGKSFVAEWQRGRCQRFGASRPRCLARRVASPARPEARNGARSCRGCRSARPHGPQLEAGVTQCCRPTSSMLTRDPCALAP
jgi:hypothetical protein